MNSIKFYYQYETKPERPKTVAQIDKLRNHLGIPALINVEQLLNK